MEIQKSILEYLKEINDKMETCTKLLAEISSKLDKVKNG